jgi:arylsulfatase A-like enzyme
MSNSKKPLNVLFIVNDDGRIQHQSYGFDNSFTMPSARFASEALIFDNAYAQQAICSPSRGSFMSGRRPDTTKVWDLRGSFRLNTPEGEDWLAFPEWFKEKGYKTYGVGKLYHRLNPARYDTRSWTEPYGAFFWL